jgi:hypothetical protein
MLAVHVIAIELVVFAMLRDGLQRPFNVVSSGIDIDHGIRVERTGEREVIRRVLILTVEVWPVCH